MMTRNSHFINFSLKSSLAGLLALFACISGIALNGNFAIAQTDPRASEVAPPPTTAPSGTSKPVVSKPPVAKPAVKPTPAPTTLELSRKFPKVVTKLMVDDLTSGRGRPTKPGSQLVVHFQSWLYDPTQPLGRGPQFESTQGKAPYKFTLQSPELQHIRGWEDGLVNMKVGGKRRLIIPPDLGYGSNGAGQVIPPGATLLYEIELVDVE